MNTSSPYTNLETLLLFQYLSTNGFARTSFSKISEILKKNPYITNHKHYESGRLSPHSLESLCLRQLKEEVERQQNGASDSDGPNATPRNFRKRKSPSPTFSSVQEAAQHAHLIPQLVTRLYQHYRKALVEDIRIDEERYERLQKELQSLRSGERDSELLDRAKEKSPVPRSPSVPGKSPQVQHTPHPAAPSPSLAVQDHTPRPSAAPTVPVVDGPQHPYVEVKKAPSPLNGYAQTERDARDGPPVPPSRDFPQPPPQGPPQPPTPSGVISPVPSTPSHSQTPHPPGPPRTIQPPPPHIATYSGGIHPSPYVHTPQPQVQIPRGPQLLASPHTSDRAASPHRPSQFPPHSSPHGIPPNAQFQPPPLRPHGASVPPQPSPVPGHPPSFSPASHPPKAPFPAQSPATQMPQPPRNYHHPGPPYAPPPHAQGPPAQGGFMLQPFQVAPQDPSRVQQAPPYPQTANPLPRQSHAAKASAAAPTTLRQSLPPLQPVPHHVRDTFATPTSSRFSFPRPDSPSIIRTPLSAKTVWKRTGSRPALPVPQPEVIPIGEDESPEEQEPPKQQVKGRAARKTKAKGKGKEKDADVEPEKEHEPEHKPEPEEDQATEMETRQGRSRRKGAVKRARPGSIASSRTGGGSIRGRSRSQSVASQTDTLPGDHESQTTTGTRIKSERGASLDVVDEDVEATPSHPATRRRGAIQSTRGRKRTARDASLPPSDHEADDHAPDTASRVIIAPRHFSRMCNPIMNDIGSHKHASTFTSAVKAKNAEGYYDIIRRPTDLKSIQKAIAAGAKVVAAAAAASDASSTPVTGSPGGGGGIVELPLSEDAMPPKAIVNSAQLENELMRMFVNAVMFNPGEDGVVEDAREMFEAVQQSVSNWRSAERASIGLGGAAGMGEAGGERESTVGTPITLPASMVDEKEFGKERDDGPVSKRRKV